MKLTSSRVIDLSRWSDNLSTIVSQTEKNLEGIDRIPNDSGCGDCYFHKKPYRLDDSRIMRGGTGTL